MIFVYACLILSIINALLYTASMKQIITGAKLCSELAKLKGIFDTLYNNIIMLAVDRRERKHSILNAIELLTFTYI